jgi:hypothetical protein
VLDLARRQNIFPGFVDERLMEKAVDDARVHPVAFCLAGFEVAGYMLDVSLAARVQGRAETARPILALAEVLDHLLGVRTALASVGGLVVLVKGIGAPERAIAARLRTRILLPALVKLLFVSLPVVFPLEARLARGAPVEVEARRAG